MGFTWKSLFHTISAIAPVVMAVAGVPPMLIPVITHGIAMAEGTHTISGAEKKAHVLLDVNAAIAGINAVTPGLIPLNATVLLVDKAIDTTIAVLNVIHPKTL